MNVDNLNTVAIAISRFKNYRRKKNYFCSSLQIPGNDKALMLVGNQCVRSEACNIIWIQRKSSGSKYWRRFDQSVLRATYILSNLTWMSRSVLMIAVFRPSATVEKTYWSFVSDKWQLTSGKTSEICVRRNKRRGVQFTEPHGRTNEENITRK